jgi:hypothetical protein
MSTSFTEDEIEEETEEVLEAVHGNRLAGSDAARSVSIAYYKTIIGSCQTAIRAIKEDEARDAADDAGGDELSDLEDED